MRKEFCDECKNLISIKKLNISCVYEDDGSKIKKVFCTDCMRNALKMRRQKNDIL